jgi:hypothetical protein
VGGVARRLEDEDVTGPRDCKSFPKLKLFVVCIDVATPLGKRGPLKVKFVGHNASTPSELAGLHNWRAPFAIEQLAVTRIAVTDPSTVSRPLHLVESHRPIATRHNAGFRDPRGLCRDSGPLEER